MLFKYAIISLALTVSFSSQANLFKANNAIQNENYEVAISELNKSVRIGNAEAQFLLGVLHYQGKAGEIDKLNAVAWFFMAAEYNYPNALEYAKLAYSELSEDDKTKARALAAQYKNDYGINTLQQSLLPDVFDEPINEQRIQKSAKILKRGSLQYVRGSASARNQSAINALIRNGGSVRNLEKMLVNDDTGIVIMQYDAAIDGTARDVEVLFSWPRGRFSPQSIKSMKNSVINPAKNSDGKTAQYGLIGQTRFGFRDSTNFKSDYPHQYNRFKKLKKQADDNLLAKYNYAGFLRAYGKYLPEKDYVAFDTVLLELAESGYPQAQYDYAQYQIYNNHELDLGLEWLIKAAKNGFLPAEYRLGDILLNSPSVYLKQDINKAKRWLKSAAVRGHINAQLKYMGIILEESDISEVEINQSLTWLDNIISEDQDTITTYYLLAKAYQLSGNKEQAIENISIAIDKANALKWDTDTWKSYKNTLETGDVLAKAE